MKNIVVRASCYGVAPIVIEQSGPFLESNGIQTLVANPAGGTWSGASSDGTFDPGIGEGIYSATYTYDNGEGCVQTETIDLTVNPLRPIVSFRTWLSGPWPNSRAPMGADWLPLQLMETG